MNPSITTESPDLKGPGPIETDVAARPLTIMRPPGTRLTIDWREIWRYRELLYFLAIRDIKVRYKQTAIGVAWVVLQPIVATAILSVLFSAFARFDTRDVPYPLFALTGSLIWLFCHSSITMSSNSFIGNTNLVTKVYFPRLIMPVASTLSCVLDLLIGLAILVGLMTYYQVVPNWQLVAAPVFLFLAFLLASAVGSLFSALNVRYRDVQFGLPFLLQIWMLASPVFYPTTLLPEKWRLIFAVNPLAGILEGFRSALFGTAFEWKMIGISCISLLLLIVISLLVFRKMEDDFADMI